MPFKKGNPGKPKGSKSKKTIWILESLRENGFNYEAMLAKFLNQAAKGDRTALDMAHILVKLVPHLANAPKSDHQVNQIETLVINKYEAPRAQIEAADIVDTSTVEQDTPS